MASAPIETLLEGKGFSCEAGGNWTSGKGQGIGCVAFGACNIHSSTTGTKKRGDRTISPYLDIRRRWEDSLFETECSRAVLVPVQSGMKGKQWSGLQSMGEKGGTWSKSHEGMGVVVWPKNRMISRRVSYLVDRKRFLLPGHKGWRSLEEGAEHVRRRKGPDVLELALEEGVGPQEGVERKGWKRGIQ